MTRYKVIRTDFMHLESVLNELERKYPIYNLYQILTENSYEGSLAILVLKGWVV